MVKYTAARRMLMCAALILSGCTSYSITEQDMTDYLHDNVNFNQSIGIENVMYAQVSVDDLEVKIGRTDAERVSVFANTTAEVQMLNAEKIGLDLALEFSAIPDYQAESGEIFLKSLRLEQFDEGKQRLTPEIKALIKPAVSMIGYALSEYPVYKLDNSKVQEALLKSAEPNLVVKDNKLVIELFN
ncbi:DUF1439 domain-containing protein [Vibrio nomapromontoriensis]|uniref:DUF1439 domain-containing protein n=1 Tax=Vibrio nomapromontoriensis TaxID=2910246 RepID=UPI003D12D3DE